MKPSKRELIEALNRLLDQSTLVTTTQGFREASSHAEEILASAQQYCCGDCREQTRCFRALGYRLGDSVSDLPSRLRAAQQSLLQPNLVSRLHPGSGGARPGSGPKKKDKAS